LSLIVTFRIEGNDVTLHITRVIISNIGFFFWDVTTVVIRSSITITPTFSRADSLTITITIIITLMGSHGVIPFINIVTHVVTSWVVFTVHQVIEVGNGEVGESPSFIIGTLIDGRPEVEGSISGIVSNNNIDGIEVISPRRSTKISNIGVTPCGLLRIVVNTI